MTDFSLDLRQRRFFAWLRSLDPHQWPFVAQLPSLPFRLSGSGFKYDFGD